MKTVTLKKCAYIFHWSNSTYFYGYKKDLEKKHRINNLLKIVYEKNACRVFPYLKDAENNYQIAIDGELIRLNPQMILSIEDDTATAKIINNTSRKNLEGLKDQFAYTAYSDSDQLRSKRFSTLYIENYMNPDSLGYYRLHFNGRQICFIISNNTVYSAERLKKLDTWEIYLQINATSDKARKEIKTILDYLKV